MTNPNKAKGTAWESDIVRYLKANGLPTAHRIAQTGRDDSGDIHGVSPFILQAKTYANLADGLRAGVAGANRQALIAGEPYGAAVVKRRGKSTADAYVVMDLATFTRLLCDVRASDRLGLIDVTPGAVWQVPNAWDYGWADTRPPADSPR